MKKGRLLFVLLMACAMVAAAQDVLPFKGSYVNKKWNIRLELDLYDTTLVVPDYEFLGRMNGYLQGDLHETWFLTTFERHKDKATLFLSNEMGADNQPLLLTQIDSLHLQYEVQGTNYLRKAVNRKWVKLPAKMLFERTDKGAAPKETPQRFRMY